MNKELGIEKLKDRGKAFFFLFEENIKYVVIEYLDLVDFQQSR